MRQFFTIGEMLLYIENNYSNPKALATYTEKGWETTSTSEMVREIKHVALGLVQLGVKPGEKIGIVAMPSSHWTIVDLAIMAAGAISVPLFANISEDNFLFEITQPDIKTVFVGGADQWRRIEMHKNMFKRVIALDTLQNDTQALAYEDLLKLGEQYEREHPDFYHAHLKKISPNAIATIIYTSGSTGVPKGAVHSHRSITSLLNTAIFNWDRHTDSYLSFLPLAHVFARVLNLIMISWGISAHYYNDIKNIGAACQEIKPSVMVVVPRLLEKMYAKMVSKVHSGSYLKKIIGLAAFRHANHESGSSSKRLLKPLFDRLVYSKLRAALGGNLRVVFSGGAALNPGLYRFFIEAGFPIYEGWGLTESCPVTVNQIGKIKVGTVGTPIPGMYVRVSDEGELLVSGEMMMREYYNNPKDTAAMIDSEGWLHTGDKGKIDENGYVTIIGRSKEIFKTSTGEIIAPVRIELALSKSPYIDQAIVIADTRKFASALLIPDFDAIKLLKKQKNMPALTDEEFLKSDIMKAEIEKLLSQVNENLNHWEKIRDYRFLLQPLSIDSGELTPTMKIRREVIETKYKKLIDSIYQEDSV